VGERLRVATFNIRTSNGHDGRNHWLWRRRACAAAIRGFGADVIGLQEVRPGQLAYLRRALPEYAFAGRGRDRAGGGEHASVLVGGGWTLESQETRWLSERPDVPGSIGWDAGLTRIATLARLRRGTVRLGVANAHFDGHGRRSREHSAQLLVEWLQAEPDRPWLVLGDLNAPPGSAPLRTLTAAGFADPLPLDAGGTEHSFTGATDRKRIDFVLAGPGVSVTAAWIDHPRPFGRLPSDHWPVLADVELAG
jgi:endonuclease/exonuclease/phosphatase family metal-dependent hydrolase